MGRLATPMTGQQGCTVGNKSTHFTEGDVCYLQSFFKEESLVDLGSDHQKNYPTHVAVKRKQNPSEADRLGFGLVEAPSGVPCCPSSGDAQAALRRALP